ncbi:MAG: hypothetical protein IKH26_10660 [Bacteroidaceae bacterium]|nr:hypothetical protein [Bacteroidaceae bacterium]
MKKLVFMFVAVLAVSFASCGDAPKKVAETVDSVKAEAAEVVDSAAAKLDSAATQLDSTANAVVDSVKAAL